MTEEKMVYRGFAYCIRKSIASKSGVFPDVICANDGGGSGFYALCLLKKPIMKQGAIVLYKLCTFKYDDIAKDLT